MTPTSESKPLKLEPAAPIPPAGLRELLEDLGDGENGYMGTPVPSGKSTLEDYLRQCVAMTDSAQVPPGLVPQTTFWVLDADGVAIGMVRMRHCLNKKLLAHGGHIGIYIRRDRRGRGHAKEILRLALAELRKTGEKRALLTISVDNLPSIRSVESVGGRLEDIRTDPGTGMKLARYWIDL